MTNKIDNKVAEYLERATRILARELGVATPKFTGWSTQIIEIAKMIQLEEHQDDQRRAWNLQAGVDNI